MTLDEAIEHAKEKSKGSSQCAKDHRQLVKWLTDLKKKLDDELIPTDLIEEVPSAEAEGRLYIKIYADDEPSVMAEKLYQICGETQNGEVAEWLKEYFPSAESCDKDAISREGLLRSWEELSPRGRIEFDQVIMTIPALPSVEPKTGVWTRSHIGTIAEGYYCSRCGKHGYCTDFCENCGADMRGEEE